MVALRLISSLELAVQPNGTRSITVAKASEQMSHAIVARNDTLLKIVCSVGNVVGMRSVAWLGRF